MLVLISVVHKLDVEHRYILYIYHRLVSLVVKVPVYRVGGSGSIPNRTNIQGFEIIAPTSTNG